MEEKIINLLRSTGGRLTRQQLWERLALPDQMPTDEYWNTEQSLVDAKVIERRRGRNGGIYLIEESGGPIVPTDEGYTTIGTVEDRRLEAQHYKPALNSILENWPEQPGFTHVFGAITAGQGARPTGGRWSRPDIIICTVSEWIFSSRPEGDVRTLEVKRYESLDVLAVYEALSHRSRAHYAYLLIVNFPSELTDDQKGEFDAILSVAARHGIGVITAADSADWRTWNFELDALRSNADHQAIHQFVLDQLPRDVREDFHQKLRTIVIKV